MVASSLPYYPLHPDPARRSPEPQGPLQLLSQSVRDSSAGIMLGGAAWSRGKLSVAGDRISMHHPGVECHLTLESERARRLEVRNHRWKMCLRSHLEHRERWVERFSEMTEFGLHEDMEAGIHPLKREATKVFADGGVLTCSLQRNNDRALDFERIAKTTCLTHVDRSRVEEQETLIREGDQERYLLTRAEYDQGRRRTKLLRYRYPSQARSFYEHVRRRLLEFNVAP